MEDKRKKLLDLLFLRRIFEIINCRSEDLEKKETIKTLSLYFGCLTYEDNFITHKYLMDSGEDKFIMTIWKLLDFYGQRYNELEEECSIGKKFLEKLNNKISKMLKELNPFLEKIFEFEIKKFNPFLAERITNNFHSTFFRNEEFTYLKTCFKNTIEFVKPYINWNAKNKEDLFTDFYKIEKPEIQNYIKGKQKIKTITEKIDFDFKKFEELREEIEILEAKRKVFEDEIKMSNIKKIKSFREVKRFLQVTMEYYNLRKYSDDMSGNKELDKMSEKELISWCIFSREIARFFLSDTFFSKNDIKNVAYYQKNLKFFRDILVKPYKKFNSKRKELNKENIISWLKKHKLNIDEMLCARYETINSIIKNANENKNFECLWKIFVNEDNKLNIINKDYRERREYYLYTYDRIDNTKLKLSQFFEKINLENKYVEFVKFLRKNEEYDKNSLDTSFEKPEPFNKSDYWTDSQLTEEEIFKKIVHDLKTACLFFRASLQIFENNKETIVRRLKDDNEFRNLTNRQIQKVHHYLEELDTDKFDGPLLSELNRVKDLIRFYRNLITHDLWNNHYEQIGIFFVIGYLCLRIIKKLTYEPLSQDDIKYYRLDIFEIREKQIIPFLEDNDYRIKLLKELNDVGAISNLYYDDRLFNKALDENCIEKAKVFYKMEEGGISNGESIERSHFIFLHFTPEEIKEIIKTNKTADFCDNPFLVILFDERTKMNIKKKIEIAEILLAKYDPYMRDLHNGNTFCHQFSEIDVCEDMKKFVLKHKFCLKIPNDKGATALSNMLQGNFGDKWLETVKTYTKINLHLEKHLKEDMESEDRKITIDEKFSIEDVKLDFKYLDINRFFLIMEKTDCGYSDKFKVLFDRETDDNLINEKKFPFLFSFKPFGAEKESSYEIILCMENENFKCSFNISNGIELKADLIIGCKCLPENKNFTNVDYLKEILHFKSK